MSKCKHYFGPVLDGLIQLCDHCRAYRSVSTYDVHTKEGVHIVDGTTGKEYSSIETIDTDYRVDAKAHGRAAYMILVVKEVIGDDMTKHVINAHAVQVIKGHRSLHVIVYQGLSSAFTTPVKLTFENWIGYELDCCPGKGYSDIQT